MEVINAIVGRRSIREFKSDLVSSEDITMIIEAALAAPSKGNSQIWEFVVVTGEKKRVMDEMLLNLLKTDLIPSMKLSESDEVTSNDALKKAEMRSSRHRQEISKILSPLGLSVDEFMLEGTFSFFGAPVAILIFVDEVFAKDLPHTLSVGAAVQNILLAAMDKGLGTCWIGGVWRYTKDIRTYLGIPDNKKLFSAIALGHPDNNSPINRYKSTRDDINEFVRWIGFEG
jgi:nitroreductase